MLVPELKFVDSGSASTFEQLCDELHGVLQNDTIILNNDVWKGTIKKVEVEPGLYVHFWSCSLLSPLILKHEVADATAQSAYHLIYSLTPGVFFLKHERSAQIFAPPHADTFCTTNQTKVYFELAPHDQVRVIYISMTEEWIRQYFQNTDRLNTELILPPEMNARPLLLFDITDKGEYLLASEIADHLQNVQINQLLIHSRILLLILQFFNKWVHSKHEKNKKIREHFDKLKLTEKIVSSHLSGKLPSLKEISEMVQMNETALKRYFKLLYGKNIYEYYLQQKMDLAKRMLIDENLNINEVAAQLGYEKASNFIEIFKTHFGFLPGSLRKNPFNDK
jgi:AraC-like DNA-binding protein